MECDEIMGKFQDLSGQQFGRWTVIKRVFNRKYRTEYLCKCSCGNEKIVLGCNLKRGLTLSCGCLSSEKAAERKFIDLTGEKYGRLLVMEQAESNIQPNGTCKTKWKCLCDCGNYTIVDAYNLKSGHTSSCGCYNSDVSKSKIEDITNQRFGNLVVIERAENQKEQIMWLCQCDCGNKCVVNGYHLKKGHTKSCGCIKSFGEYNVNTYLSSNNINYDTQVGFDRLLGVGGKKLTYDFYLPDYSLFIECQGQQHYRPIDVYGGEEQFAIQQEHDKRKRYYVENNNYELLEIPYWEYDNIENILNEKLKEVRQNARA